VVTSPPILNKELTFVKKECLASRLRAYPIWRSLAWKVLLGVLYVGDRPKEEEEDFVDVALANPGANDDLTPSFTSSDSDQAGGVPWSTVHDKWRKSIDDWIGRYNKSKTAAYVDPRAGDKPPESDASDFNPLTDSGIPLHATV